ncbi:MAG: 1-deoxy-D-xylulose-5-phosphate synthase [Solobacterium sp.]|nr:1-deoxy-D-xylulose-5-phosphate synthase [Solobacterium sp.]
MNLSNIKEPKDIQSLSIKELNELAKDIRSFLISSVSKTGGHLASNLGIVELTLALHYVFQSPTDKIFFDVGHQCYTHKILTGRANGFAHLRQYNGISGFQKRCESKHDVWEAGHSSTALSAGLGMAIARDLNKENYHIIPVVGDGAMSSGMSLEALNQIGSEQRNMIIIFNDNNMSISKNVGALNSEFSRLRASKAYTGIKSGMRKSLETSNVGNTIISGLKSIKDTLKNVVIDGGIFEEFHIDYIGPIDGHNIAELIRVLHVAKEHDGPIVIHVITQKGKGYAPCEMDREGIWHGIGPFDITTGKPKHAVATGYESWSSCISSHLLYLAKKNKDIVAITPAMIQGSALNNFFAKYPDRSFDCGIAEEHAATFAAGLAINQKRPFLSIYSSFLQRAYDQINHDICRMDLPVVIGVDRAGLVGEDGPTHHGVFDIGLLTPLPNLILAQPKDAHEAQMLLNTAFKQEHPFVIRYPRGTTQKASPTDEIIEIGSWEMINEDDHTQAYILTYGEDFNSLKEKVLSNHLPYAIVNCRFFKPLDEKMLTHIAKSEAKLFTVEGDMLSHGLSSCILEYLNDHNLQKKIRRFGISDKYIGQGSNRQLRKEIAIDVESILNEIEKELRDA